MPTESTIEAILECQVQKWFPRFSHLCYPRRLLKLPGAFVEYLISDGVYSHEATRLFGERKEESTDESESGEEEMCDPTSLFPDVVEEIEGLIAELGGCVVPKLTWSAPKDAIWLSPERNMKCTSAEEVIMFLKSSDRVAHDICSPFDDSSSGQSVDHVLCLSKFFDLNPYSEFRCFVKNDRLIGVSQRDVTQYYPQLRGEDARIRNVCSEFFNRYVQTQFKLCQYSFDVYITRRDKVKLLDINAVCASSSPLLFSWEELELDFANRDPPRIARDEIEVRFVEDDGSIMMGQTMAVSMPYDMIGCSIAEALEKMKSANLNQ